VRAVGPFLTVRFTTAVYGIHRPGTAYRRDERPIPLRAFLPTGYPSHFDGPQGIEKLVVPMERRPR
jgi:hypothetical protein